MLSQITPVLLTFNEAENIGRTLASLQWASDIVVVDSGSTDATLSIVAEMTQARVFRRVFDTHADQWRFAISETNIKSPWILRLDADYQLPPELIKELSTLDPDAPVSAYRIAFDYAIFGRKLSGSLYPPNTILLRQNTFAIFNTGHTERWQVSGPVLDLRNRVIHDDRKPLKRWLASQQRYAALQADYLLRAKPGSLGRNDRLRRLGWCAPMLVFVYALVVKRCLFDGWPGWFYALQRLVAESMIALELTERRLSRSDGSAE